MDEINKRLDEINAELSKEDISAEQVSAYETEVNDLEQRKADLVKTAETRQATLDKVAKIVTPIEEVKEERKEEIKMEDEKVLYRSAYLKKLQGKELSEAETRAATASANVAGAMPEETLNTIFDKVVKKVPMLDEVTLLHVKGGVKFAVETARTDGANHTENAEVTPDTLTLTTVELSGSEIVKYVEISESVKTMSITDFENWLTDMLSDSVANAIEGKIINSIETNGTAKAGAITAAVIREGIGSLPAAYDANAKFYCPKSLFYGTILGLQDNSKSDIVVREGNEYKIYGYPVRISDKSTKLVLCDPKRFVANLAKDITINGGYNVSKANYGYNGVAIYDGKLADATAAVVFANA